ncbi:hypothetical protein P775_26720 [Puniceibacterium antarcticum]|uniref:Uncharacterized protein n=1 Tax=Puniceibacterium antarcticum TaxID=1206336 RepID=A0A2G8QYN2_9RHOB|nr:hypothetical protein P775_26720 [Puniceibacterium antarcticum]
MDITSVQNAVFRPVTALDFSHEALPGFVAFYF